MGLGSFIKKVHDPFGHKKKTKKELGRAAKKAGLDDMLAFEKNNLSYWWDAIKKDPERLLMPIFGADPIQSKVFGEILNKDYEPMLNQMGGPSKGAYIDAAKKGIDTSSSAGAHQVAAAVASWYAGGALAAAAPAAVPISQGVAAGAVGAGAGAIDEELDPIDLGGLQTASRPPGSLRVGNVPGFEEGGEVKKAPWPDSTAAEDAAYALEAQMWDFEFEREVVQQGGPQLAEHFDADKARMLPVGNWDLQGLYRPPGAKSIMDIERYKPVADILREKGIEPPAEDTVSAVGASNATPQIWAHEFSHRRDETEQRSTGERYNLIHDAFRSDNAFEWADSVTRWKRFNQRRFDKDDSIKTYADIERDLKETIATNRNTLLQEEVDARESEGDVPIDREGWFTSDSLFKDQEEQLERRAHSWSIKKYNELVRDIQNQGRR